MAGNNLAQVWANISTNENTILESSPAGPRLEARQANSGAYTAGTDWTGVRSSRAADPSNPLLSQIANMVGVPCSNFADVLTAINAGARTIRLCPGTFTWTTMINLATLARDLVFVVMAGDTVIVNVPAAFAGAAITLGGRKLTWVVGAGASLTVNDQRAASGVTITTAVGDGSACVNVVVDDCGTFAYNNTGTGGVFVDVTAASGGNSYINLNANGANFTFGAPDETSALVRPAGAATTALQGFRGIIDRCNIITGRFLHFDNSTAGGLGVSRSTLTFYNRATLGGAVSSNITGSINAALAASYPTIGGEVYPALRVADQLIETPVALTFSGSATANFNALTLAAATAQTSTVTFAGTTGGGGFHGDVQIFGASVLSSLAFTASGMATTNERPFLLANGSAGLTGRALRFNGLQDIEFSASVADVIDLLGLYFNGYTALRFSDAPQDVIINSGANAGPTVVQAPLGIGEVQVTSGTNYVTIDNGTVGYVVAPPSPTRTVVYEEITNVQGPGPFTALNLQGAFFFKVTDVMVPNGTLTLGTGTAFDYLFIDNVIASTINAVGNGAASGFHGNLGVLTAANLLGNFFTDATYTAVNTPLDDATATPAAFDPTLRVWTQGATTVTGFPMATKSII